MGEFSILPWRHTIDPRRILVLMPNPFVIRVALLIGLGLLFSCDDSTSGGSGNNEFVSVAECVQSDFASCVERYGEGNYEIWLGITEISIDEFDIETDWCG
jgi:hypothetical protein